MKLYRIRNWSKLFENNRTKEIKHMAWVPIPNKQDGDGYTQVMDRPDGAAIFGAWIACVQIASRCDPRGTLIRDGGKPHDSQSLSRMSRMPPAVIQAMLEALSNPDVNWLEVNPAGACDNPAGGCAAGKHDPESAKIPQSDDTHGSHGSINESPRTDRSLNAVNRVNSGTSESPAGACDNPAPSCGNPAGTCLEQNRTEQNRREQNESEPVAPSLTEVVAFGANWPGNMNAGIAAGIPSDYCKHYHAVNTEKHRWNVRGKLIVWQSEIVRWWERDRHTWGKGRQIEDAAKDDFWRNSKQLDQVESAIKLIEGRASHTAMGITVEPADKAKYATLKARRKELKKALGL